MKKFAITLLTAGLLISSNLSAQENAGGTYSSKYGIGQMTLPQIVAAATVAAVTAAAVANSSGKVKTKPVTTCPDGQELVGGVCTPIETVYTCADGDAAPVNGVCIGTASTVTVTASGTNGATKTITVPVTFTYPASAS